MKSSLQRNGALRVADWATPSPGRTPGARRSLGLLRPLSRLVPASSTRSAARDQRINHTDGMPSPARAHIRPILTPSRTCRAIAMPQAPNKRGLSCSPSRVPGSVHEPGRSQAYGPSKVSRGNLGTLCHTPQPFSSLPPPPGFCHEANVGARPVGLLKRIGRPMTDSTTPGRPSHRLGAHEENRGAQIVAVLPWKHDVQLV